MLHGYSINEFVLKCLYFILKCLYFFLKCLYVFLKCSYFFYKMLVFFSKMLLQVVIQSKTSKIFACCVEKSKRKRF